MFKNRAIIGLVLGGAILAGCKDEKKVPEVAAPATPAAPTTPAIPALPTTPAGPPTSAPVVSVPSVPAITTPTTLPSLPATSAPLTTTTPGTPDATASATDAKALLVDAEKNVEAKKWDAAGDDFKKLNAMQGSLSPEMKDTIKSAEAKFLGAKAASSLKIPGLGGDSAPSTPSEPNK